MKSYMLSEKGKGTSNNLNLMRFFAALSVIYFHTYALNGSEGELVQVLSKGSANFGAIAVSIFFLCGGYLIAKSTERVKTAKHFFKARIKRLFPPLFFVVLMSMLLGCLLSIVSPKEYFSNIQTWKYLLNSVLVLVHDLPGVFTNNPQYTTINGSLWTLPVEFVCYVLCYVSYKMGLFDRKKFIWTLIPVILLVVTHLLGIFVRYPAIDGAIRPMAMFYLGMLIWIYKERIRMCNYVFYITTILFFVFLLLGRFELAVYLCFPYTLFYIWFVMPQVNNKIANLGNYSYGIYLCAFPIQQFFISLGGHFTSVWVNVILTSFIAILVGIFIYHIIDKQMDKI